MYCLDLSTMIWEEKASSTPPPEPRSSCPAVYVAPYGDYDPRIVLTGGTGKTGLFADVWTFNLNNLVWTKVQNQTGAVPAPFYGHVCVFYRNHVVIHGGNRGKRTDQLLTFNLDTGEWTSFHEKIQDPDSIPTARDGHSTFLLNDKMMIYGGYSGGKASSDIWFLHLDSLIDHKIVSWTKQSRGEDSNFNIPALSYACTISSGRGILGDNFFTFAGWDSTWKNTFFKWNIERPSTIGSSELITQLLDKLGSDSDSDFVPRQLVEFRVPSMADWFPVWEPDLGGKASKISFIAPTDSLVTLYNNIPIFSGTLVLEKHTEQNKKLLSQYPLYPSSGNASDSMDMETEADTSNSISNFAKSLTSPTPSAPPADSIITTGAPERCAKFIQNFLVADVLEETLIPQYDFLTTISLWITTTQIFKIPRVAVWAANRICSKASSLSRKISSNDSINIDIILAQINLLSQLKGTYPPDLYSTPFQTLNKYLAPCNNPILVKHLSQLLLDGPNSSSTSDSAPPSYTMAFSMKKKALLSLALPPTNNSPQVASPYLQFAPLPASTLISDLENFMKNDSTHLLIATHIRGIDIEAIKESLGKNAMVRLFYWIYTGDLCRSLPSESLTVDLIFSILQVLPRIFPSRNPGYFDICTQFAQILLRQPLDINALTERISEYSVSSQSGPLPPEVMMKFPQSVQSTYFTWATYGLADRVTSLETTVKSLQHIVRDQHVLIMNLTKRMAKIDNP